MMAPSVQLHPRLAGTLRRFRSRLVLLRALTAIGCTVAVAAGTIGLALLVDRYFLLSVALRVGVSAITGVAIVGVGFAWLLFLLRSLPRRQIARIVERVTPELEEGLISSVMLWEDRQTAQHSPELFAALQESTATQLERFSPVDRLSLKPARWPLVAAAALILLLAFPATLYPESFFALTDRLLHPTANLPRPSTVHLSVEPGNVRVATGSEIEIIARAEQGSPAMANLTWRPANDSLLREEILRFHDNANKRYVRRTFPPLKASFEYRVDADDYASPWYRVDVRDPPRPLSFEFQFEDPAYTGRKPFTREATAGHIRALEGSHVRILVVASEPLKHARLRRHSRPDAASGVTTSAPIDLAIDDRRAWLDGFEIDETLVSYELYLEGLDGVHNDSSARYEVEVASDKPPRITVTRPRSVVISVETSSVIHLEYRATDDVGLQSVDLVARSGSDDEITIAVIPSRKDVPTDSHDSNPYVRRRWERSVRIDVTRFAIEAGGALPFVLKATDVRGQAARSAEHQLHVDFLPAIPEGGEWLRDLATLDKSLAAALVMWQNLPLFGRDATPQQLFLDAATTEQLNRAAGITLTLMTRIKRTAKGMIDRAASIPVATPQQRTLALLARDLRTQVTRAQSYFWASVTAFRGVQNETIDARSLNELYRLSGAHLEEASADMRALRRFETLDDAVARLEALTLDQQQLIASWRLVSDGTAASESERHRLQRREEILLEEATAIGGRLISLTTRNRETGEQQSKKPWGAAYIETVVPPLDALRMALQAGDETRVSSAAAAAFASLDAAGQSLQQATRTAQQSLRSVRKRLEGKAPLSERLKIVASSLQVAADEPAATNRLSRAVALLEEFQIDLTEELELLENGSYADLDSVIELTAVGEIMQAIGSALPSRERTSTEQAQTLSALAKQTDQVASALGRTAVSRAVGLSLQLFDSVAASQEELATRLRRAREWKPREQQLGRRTQVRAREALDYGYEGLKDLGRIDNLPARDKTALRDGLSQPLKSAEAAFRNMGSVVKQLSTPTGDDTQNAWEEARNAARHVDTVMTRMEDLRVAALHDAAAARRWLRERRGTLPSRILRLAQRESEHAAEVQALSQVEAIGELRSLPPLFREHEAIRTTVKELARQARQSGDAALTQDNDQQATARFDDTSDRLVSIADGMMREASRALYAAENGQPEEAAGLCAQAALLEERAVTALRRLAQALDVIETDAALEEIEKQLQELLGKGESETDADPPKTLKQIRTEAELLLAKCEDHIGPLAQRLQKEPLYSPVLNAVREAMERLRAALSAVEEEQRDLADRELNAGRQKLQDAARLATQFRAEQEKRLADAQQNLQEGGEHAPTDGADAAQKEFDALRAEVQKSLDKMLATRRILQQADLLFKQILNEDKLTEEQKEAIRQEEERALEEFDRKFMTTSDLVTLVATLLKIEKQVQIIRDDESGIARDLLVLRSVTELAELRKLQGAVTQHAQTIVEEFGQAGFRLSATLPQVLRAYWQAGESADTFSKTVRRAQEQLDTADKSVVSAAEKKEHLAGELFAAAKSVEPFLKSLFELRQLALQAIAEQESGIDQSSAGQRQMDQAHGALAEALELLKQGNPEGAQAAHRKSMRSLADAMQALRRGSQLDGAFFGSDSYAAASGLEREWMAVTRGDDSLEQIRFLSPEGFEDMPYPIEFRDLVQLYLQLLKERRM